MDKPKKKVNKICLGAIILIVIWIIIIAVNYVITTEDPELKATAIKNGVIDEANRNATVNVDFQITNTDRGTATLRIIEANFYVDGVFIGPGYVSKEYDNEFDVRNEEIQTVKFVIYNVPQNVNTIGDVDVQVQGKAKLDVGIRNIEFSFYKVDNLNFKEE
jgi:LEA14-like dessication related protein